MVVGDDFRYGSKACGTIESLRAAGQARGFGVEQMAPFVLDGVRVTSTAVRERLERADLHGRSAASGAPLSNDRPRGARPRTGPHAGFSDGEPAAHAAQAADPGVSAVRVHGIERRPLDGVASLGTRPTVNGTEPLLEVHVFDFAGDLYGRLIEVEFIAKLRDEVKFDSLDAMIVQMKVDAAQAREVVVEGG